MAGTAVDPRAPAPYRRWMIAFWVAWAVLMLVTSFRVDVFAPRGPMTPYESTVKIAGLPLYAYGEHPRGIVAVGGFPIGVVAIGGVAVGGIAIGGVAVGGIALGGLGAGVLVLAGGALGWWAVGGGAVGRYACGGLAIGSHAYAGSGVALGYDEAHGRQKERLLG